MSTMSSLDCAPVRKRLLSPAARRISMLLPMLAAASSCLLASACSDDEKPVRLTPAAEAQQSDLARASGDSQSAPPAAALTIQTPSQETAPGNVDATAQAGVAASGSLAPPVIHTVD
jgi:hypothetical protein